MSSPGPQAALPAGGSHDQSTLLPPPLLPKRTDSLNSLSQHLSSPLPLPGNGETTPQSLAEGGDDNDDDDDDNANNNIQNRSHLNNEMMDIMENNHGESLVSPMDKLSLSSGMQRKSSGQSVLRVETSSDLPPLPPVKDEPYLDPTPKTPIAPRSPLSNPAEFKEKELPEVPLAAQQDGNDQGEPQEGRKSEDSQSEIQSIMEQFADESKSLGQEEIMSPRLGLADQFRTAQGHFPPRRSSLGPVLPEDGSLDQQRFAWKSRPASLLSHRSSSPPPAPPPKSPPTVSGSRKQPQQQSQHLQHHHLDGELVPGHSTQPTQAGVIPPAPEPEPHLPFDFHRFLEQLRHRTADPVAKYLRSFLTEFGKKQWMVHEQVKIISDFLAFITNKMAHCEVWRGISDVEFDNAKEGMEKLVMNRLYSQTFSPAIPPPPPAPSRSRSRSRRKEPDGRFQGPGRRGQHQEDVERDEILAQKIRIYGWVREEHLDIPPLGANGRRFLTLAQQELLKIKGYRAPRDKVICVMNCCKVIFGLLRNSKSSDTSADSFIPLLIYVVLKANPEHLVSNVQYILRFRNQEKLGGEAGYYLSSLSGAIQFIEGLDRTSLTVSDEDFEKNVEAAVSAIAERNRMSEESASTEKSNAGLDGGTPRTSGEGEASFRTHKAGLSASDTEENAAVSGILRTIQKPLTTIGRIFSDDNEPLPPPSQHHQRAQTPVYHQQQIPAQVHLQTPSAQRQGRSEQVASSAQAQASAYDAQEAAARQASAEAAEARRIQRAEHHDVVETLSSMFPNLDKDIIDDVVRMKEGRVGLAVDACLALSAES